MINNSTALDTSPIRKFYEEAFQTLNRNEKTPEIAVEFYPYIGINHTIRVRSGKIFVRLAEICQNAPLNVQRALAFILTAKLLRRKVSPLANEIYREFIKSQEIQERAKENKRAKGRKILSGALGETYDLEKIFAEINAHYFQNQIPKTTLTWSPKKTFRILGHHDATHETIVISRSLDDKNVPRFVVEFVVFHEMLHIFHPTEQRDGRHYNHTPQFRRDEKKFVFYTEAENWIEENAGKLRAKVRKSKRGKR